MEDPTEQSLWRPLHELLARMDGEIGRIYTDRAIQGLKPTYVRELLQLHLKGPMTITELADAIGRTHSALSQKVAAMRAAGRSPGTIRLHRHYLRHLAGYARSPWAATPAQLTRALAGAALARMSRMAG